jgi:cupin fold WbuC family metalloprotein
MLNLKMKTTETYEATDAVVHVSQAELDFLAEAIHRSPRKRTRICTHKSVAERLHEMFVIYGQETYVRPNRHFGKDESVFVLEGRADFVFFDEQGEITQVVRMGDHSTGLAYYCRVPAGVFHTILIRSERILLFEGTPGPFDPSDTAYADWAPAEADAKGVAAYREDLDRRLPAFPSRSLVQGDGPDVPGLKTLNAQVLAAIEPVVPLGTEENEFLKERLRRDHLDRIRICCHRTIADRLHEMLMVFSGDTYIRPSLHVDKEESLLLLEGFATYFFFDNHGNVTNHVALGPVHSGRSFYCRIPANTYHCLVVESEVIVAKETTSGPFTREDTRFAPWAPDGKDGGAVAKYLGTLRKTLRWSA